MPRSRLPRSDIPNMPKSISPRRNRDPPPGYKISHRSPPESPATKPISPGKLSKMIALIKAEIKNEDVSGIIISNIQKTVEKQRIKWEKKQNQRFFDISTLKYGPRGYN